MNAYLKVEAKDAKMWKIFQSGELVQQRTTLQEGEETAAPLKY